MKNVNSNVTQGCHLSLPNWMTVILCFFCFSTFAATAVTNCEVGFSYQNSSETASSSTKVIFMNASSGDYTNALWDFGDGTTSESIEQIVEHYYTFGGTYEINLTIWNEDGSCQDQIFDEINILGLTTEDCVEMDCVFPGNTNADEQADLSDLLNLGLGYGVTGPVRENASFNWEPQVAEDWAESTPSGINYKHLDCNGDGTIDQSDLMPILFNYSAMDLGLDDVTEEGPRVYLQPDVDTIYINELSPEYLTINASLVFGESEEPIENIYAMAAQVGFDSSYVKPIQGVSINYNQSNFIRNGELVLNYGQNMRDDQQVDLALSRLNGVSRSGYGRVASISYIIIADIIGGRTDAVTSFDLPIEGIKVVDEFGTPLHVRLDAEPAKVIFINEQTTQTIAPELAQKIRIFPNPAIDQVQIDLGELKGERIQLFNTIGQQVYQKNISNSIEVLETSSFNRGLYLLQITTDEGTITERVLLK